MKSDSLLSLLGLAVAIYPRFCAATGNPVLQWDPDTVKTCVEWYNNTDGESCEYVRDYYNITPEQFNEWNPSVGLGCTEWNYQSYCIVTEERLASFSATMIKTTSSEPAATTMTITSTTLGPSPTAWIERGCYADNDELPVLEQRVSGKDGDPALTIPKCQDACYRLGLEFAGVEGGNTCWCSSYVAGEWTRNQSDCNLPCSADDDAICGGKGCISVFEAAEADDEYYNGDDGTTTTSAATAGRATSSTTAAGRTASSTTRVPTSTASSGAMKMPMLFKAW